MHNIYHVLNQKAYDPLGRRVRRSVDTFDGNTWSQTKDTHNSYWDWHVIEAHTAKADSDPETRHLFWGEDLSGSFQGAGGVGGLIASEAGSKRWCYHYDGNGNVTELTDNSGNVVATYRYTAFGQLRSSSGSAAEANDYRFSTKPFDATSECYYYGYRYYDPMMGRWLNRDPILEFSLEQTFLFNLIFKINWNDQQPNIKYSPDAYNVVQNNTICFVDLLGLIKFRPISPKTFFKPTRFGNPEVKHYTVECLYRYEAEVRDKNGCCLNIQCKYDCYENNLRSIPIQCNTTCKSSITVQKTKFYIP